MISLEKWMILAPLRKLPNNVGNLGKIIVATGFEWFPKVQKITQSGHTGNKWESLSRLWPKVFVSYFKENYENLSSSNDRREIDSFLWIKKPFHNWGQNGNHWWKVEKTWSYTGEQHAKQISMIYNTKDGWLTMYGFFKNGSTPASFSFIFGLFKLQKDQIDVKKSCLSNILHWDLNPRPL